MGAKLLEACAGLQYPDEDEDDINSAFFLEFCILINFWIVQEFIYDGLTIM